MTEDRKSYVAPQLVCVTIKAERGYAESTFRLSLDALNLSESDDNVENRTNGGNWGGSDTWF
jgi:hypothetical protein